jgi:hypothetical protein
MKTIFLLSILFLFAVLSFAQNATKDLQIKFNRQVARVAYANGDYFGDIVIDNPNSQKLTFTILDGNTDKTFKFGTCAQEAYYGCLFINNREGMLNPDGSVKHDKYTLKIAIRTKDNKIVATVVIWVMTYHSIIIRQNPIVIK